MKVPIEESPWPDTAVHLADNDFSRLRNPTSATKRVLLVEDDHALATALSSRLNSMGFDVTAVHDGVGAFELMRNKTHDVVLLDLGLPRMHGLKLLHQARMDGDIEPIPVVVLTGADEREVERARRRGVYAIHQKPARPWKIAESLRDAVAFQ